MSDQPNPLYVAAVKFAAAASNILTMLMAVVERWQLPPGWESVGENLNLMRDHRYEVTAFLVEHGRENPETARQLVAAALDACQEGKQQFERNGLADMDLRGLLFDVTESVHPILQAIQLYQTVELAGEGQTLCQPTAPLPTGTQRGEGGRPPADPGQPSKDRQDDITSAILTKGTPLTRPELVDAMKLKTEGKLGHHLAWMVTNNILVNIPQRGYWPAGHPVPE